MTLLEIDQLSVEFPGRRGTTVAVQEVSLSLEAGEILGVVGESGAGKSTVGNALIGLLEAPGRISGGVIRVEGEELTVERKRVMRGCDISMIFQDPLTSLNPLQTVGDQLTETISRHLGFGYQASLERAVDLLREVGIPDPELRITHYPHQFSGGMRQRVVIALALCGEPRLVIADEPTTALDVSIQAQILELLKRLCREQNMGMLLITHDMGVIAETCNRVAVMYRGCLVEEGETTQILRDPQHNYTQSLISAVPPPNQRLERFPVVEYIEEAGEHKKAIDLSTHWLGTPQDHAGATGELLQVNDLHMRFLTRYSLWPSRRRYLDAVKDVNFGIHNSEVFGLVGESGSGKTTVARMVAGLYTPSGGDVNFDGRRIEGTHSDIQMIFQDPYSSLNPRMRVFDIIAEPIRFHRMTGSRAETRDVVHDLLDYVGLGADAAHKYPHEFSGGQRQRISIARALATRPRFLICDEPTSALDVSIQAQILNLLKDLQEELGLTMLFISHDLPVIRQMCDRIGVMKDGQLVELRDSEELFEDPQHDYTRHLLKLMPRF